MLFVCVEEPRVPTRLSGVSVKECDSLEAALGAYRSEHRYKATWPHVVVVVQVERCQPSGGAATTDLAELLAPHGLRPVGQPHQL